MTHLLEIGCSLLGTKRGSRLTYKLTNLMFSDWMEVGFMIISMPILQKNIYKYYDEDEETTTSIEKTTLQYTSTV